MFSNPQKTNDFSPFQPSQFGESEEGQSLAPPAFDPKASPVSSPPPEGGGKYGKGPIQKKDPEDQKQAENEFVEYGFSRLAVQQQYALELYAQLTHSRLKKWESLRNMHTEVGSTLSYQEYNNSLFSMTKSLNDSWHEFTNHFITIPRMEMRLHPEYGIMLPAWEYDHPLSYGPAKKELTRLLKAGVTPTYLKEIIQLHAYQLDSDHSIRFLAELMGMDYKSIKHNYTLTQAFILDPKKVKNPIKGLPDFNDPKDPLGKKSPFKGKGSAALEIYEIRYNSPIGVSWTVKAIGGMVGISEGMTVGVTPGVSVDTHMGDAAEDIYYTPAYFKSQKAVQTKGEVGGAGGKATGGVMNIGDVNFNLAKAPSGKGLSLGASLGISIGYFKGGDPVDVTGFDKDPNELKREKSKPNWVSLIQGSVHFPTESAILEDADYETLDDVEEAMMRHEKNFPGDVFLIRIDGFSSQRWDDPEASQKKYKADLDKDKDAGYQFNKALAMNRARSVGDEMLARLQSRILSFQPGVLQGSDIIPTANVISDENLEENDPRARGAIIQVFYQDSPMGNTTYNDVDKAVYGMNNSGKF